MSSQNKFPTTTPAAALKPASTVKTALLLVDIQVGLTTTSGYFGTQRSTPSFETNVSHLLSSIRAYNKKNSTTSPNRNIFIQHVKHDSIHPDSPLYPGKPGNAIQPCAAPIEGEGVQSKSVNSAFIGTKLEAILRQEDIRQLLVCGIATDHCVSTTVRMAADLGVTKGKDERNGDDGLGVVALVEDACACFNNAGEFDAEVVHKVNVASLEGEFAVPVKVEDVLKLVLREQ